MIRAAVEADIGFELVSPFRDDHLPKIWAWLEEFPKQMVDDFCPKNFEAMAKANREQQAAGAKQYAILHDGELRGAVWGEHARDGIFSGHLVFDRYSLSSSEKMIMARAALKRFFDDGARKIMWEVFEDNRAFKVFLRRLGAEVEGVLRQSTRRNGILMDVTLLASFPEGKA